MTDDIQQPKTLGNWDTFLSQVGDIPTQLKPASQNDASALDWMSRGTVGRTDPTQFGKPQYYDDLPEMERNKSGQDRNLSVLANPFGQLPYLRAGVEAQKRGESFWGGTPQYERERKALQQYYNEAYESAPDSIKVLSQIGLPGGPTSQAAKYLTSAERPIASGAAMGAAQAGASGYLAPIEPETSDWRSRLQSAADSAPYGALAGAAAGAASKFAQPRYTSPEQNTAFIERMKNAGHSSPEEIDAFINRMGEHEGNWDYYDPQLEAPRKALPAPQKPQLDDQLPVKQARQPKREPQPVGPREVDELGYYSQALEAAKALPQEKGTPQQMLAMLKKAGVKDAEIQATNLPQFLEGRKSVTRDDIAAYLRDNRISLNERTKGLATKDDNDEYVRLHDELQNASRRLDDLRLQFPDDHPDVIEAQQQYRTLDDHLTYLSRRSFAQWSRYSLDPTNPTYRETTIYLPHRNSYEVFDTRNGTLYSTHATQEEAQATAERLRQSENYPHFDVDETRPIFQSGHFDDPNIMGHLMTSQVKLPDGTKAFNLDQIQSDWGQTLRNKGIRDEAKIAVLEQQLSDARERATLLLTQHIDEGRNILRASGADETPDVANILAVQEGWRTDGRNWWKASESEVSKELSDRAENWLRERNKIENLSWHPEQETRRLEAELYNAKTSTQGHPLVNTTDQWVSTTLRKALQQAVESGADAITIPTGDTVLSYNPGDKHGMNEFYNNIVPKNLSKILKEYDPKTPRPEHHEKVITPQSQHFGRGNGFTVFQLTNKIKEAVKKGQRMFKRGGTIHASQPLRAKRAEGGDVSDNTSYPLAYAQAVRDDLVNNFAPPKGSVPPNLETMPQYAHEALSPGNVQQVAENVANTVTPTGNIQSAADAAKAYQQGDWFGTALGAVGSIPLGAGIIVGRGSTHPAVSPMLDLAETLEKRGASAEDIWRQTAEANRHPEASGAVKLGGKWGVELDDSPARLQGFSSREDPETTWLDKLSHPAYERSEGPPNYNFMGSIHPESAGLRPESGQYTHGVYTPARAGEPAQILVSGKTPQEARETTFHELHHHLARKYEFPPGTNPTKAPFPENPQEGAWPYYAQAREMLTTPAGREEFATRYQIPADARQYLGTIGAHVAAGRISPAVDNMLKKIAADQWYRRVPGENQAEAVAARSNMPVEERRARAFWEDYPYPREEHTQLPTEGKAKGGEVTKDYTQHLPEHERNHSPDEAWEKSKHMIPYLRAGAEAHKRGEDFFGGTPQYEHQLKALQHYYHGGDVHRDDGGNVTSMEKTTPSDNSPHSDEIYDAESYLKGRGKVVPLGPNWGQNSPDANKTFPKPVDWQHELPAKRNWYGAPTGEKYEDRLQPRKHGGTVNIKVTAIHDAFKLRLEKKEKQIKALEKASQKNPKIKHKLSEAKEEANRIREHLERVKSYA